MEAQRLGLPAFASDLNPVAALTTKALIEIPPKFANHPPINPNKSDMAVWQGAAGLAHDIKYYGTWMLQQAQKRLAHLYPEAQLPDGNTAQTIAYIWARTVPSPDPMAKGAHVPLTSTFILSTKRQKAWVEIVRDSSALDGYRFQTHTGTISPEQEKKKRRGTKITGKGSFICVLTGAPIPPTYIREQGLQKKIKACLMAVVAKGSGRRIYLSPTAAQEKATDLQKPYLPELNAEIFVGRSISIPLYGITKQHDLFTPRQLTTLHTLSDLIGRAREQALLDARAAALPKDSRSLAEGGTGATAYADAVATFLAFTLDKSANLNNSLCTWGANVQCPLPLFTRQALPMIWDFAEANILGENSGSFLTTLHGQCKTLSTILSWQSTAMQGQVFHRAAQTNDFQHKSVFCTDPPYYDNVDYANLSDFFYVWLRRSLRSTWPSLFRHVLTPKDPELVATTYRHGSKQAAEQFFMDGMSKALKAMHAAATDDAPTTIFYAFKQSEIAKEGLTSPGWASFLQAVINAGFTIDGTWPLRTEKSERMNATSANALASSILLVCVKRPPDAATATRREFLARLKQEMPEALRKIQRAGVGPVDMPQAALGPGMGIFSAYAKVRESDDSEMSVRTAIALINQTRGEILGEEDAHYDSRTRFCINWFENFGMKQGKSGEAITMAQAYDLGLDDLQQAGVFLAKGGNARLLSRDEMPADWHPAQDKQATHWLMTQCLIRTFRAETGGTSAAAELLKEMETQDADAACNLAYRLYDICEKKGWAAEARDYNLFAEEFSRIEERATELAQPQPTQMEIQNV